MNDDQAKDGDLSEADKNVGDQKTEATDGKDGSAKNQTDVDPDQIDEDDPQKAQKLTQTGRDYDVDEAEE